MKSSNWIDIDMELETAQAFERLAGDLNVQPGTLLGSIILQIVIADDLLRDTGLGGFGFLRKAKIPSIEPLMRSGMRAWPMEVTPTDRLWPADVPFPWTEQQCKAAVLGYKVRWPGLMGDFTFNIPGDWEIDVKGFASIRPRRQ